MTPGWDVFLFRAVHHGLRHPALDPVMRFLSEPGWLKLPLFGVAAGLFLARGRRGALALLVCVLTITVSDQVNSRAVKPLIRRMRPSVELADTRPMFGVRRSYAFPSSHAVNVFAAAPLVRELYPSAGIAYLGIASAVALSRVYVGDHWPSDVLAGAALGLWIGWLGRKTLRRLLATAARRAGGAGPSGGP
jgi:undecaprenyl-diphosphatase